MEVDNSENLNISEETKEFHDLVDTLFNVYDSQSTTEVAVESTGEANFPDSQNIIPPLQDLKLSEVNQVISHDNDGVSEYSFQRESSVINENSFTHKYFKPFQPKTFFDKTKSNEFLSHILNKSPHATSSNDLLFEPDFENNFHEIPWHKGIEIVSKLLENYDEANYGHSETITNSDDVIPLIKECQPVIPAVSSRLSGRDRMDLSEQSDASTKSHNDDLLIALKKDDGKSVLSKLLESALSCVQQKDSALELLHMLLESHFLDESETLKSEALKILKDTSLPDEYFTKDESTQVTKTNTNSFSSNHKATLYTNSGSANIPAIKIQDYFNFLSKVIEKRSNSDSTKVPKKIIVSVPLDYITLNKKPMQ